jgi:hypothetical protein
MGNLLLEDFVKTALRRILRGGDGFDTDRQDRFHRLRAGARNENHSFLRPVRHLLPRP